MQAVRFLWRVSRLAEPGISMWRETIVHCLQVNKGAELAGLPGVSNLQDFVASILCEQTPASAQPGGWFEGRPQGGFLADEMSLLHQALHHLKVRHPTCVSLISM